MGVAVSAAIVCVGLTGKACAAMTRELYSLMLAVVLVTWALMRAQPSPVASALATADPPVAGLLAAGIAFSYVIAPRLVERASGHLRRMTSRKGIPRVSSRTLSALDPWARTIV